MTPNDFVKDLAHASGLPEADVRDYLKKHFGAFNKNKVPEMHKAVMEYSRVKKGLAKPPLQKCPYCKSGDIHTPTHSIHWVCSIGGVKCYYRWRTEAIMKELGYEKPNWQVTEQYYAELMKDGAIWHDRN